jgi:hypothetical protein
MCLYSLGRVIERQLGTIPAVVYAVELPFDYIDPVNALLPYVIVKRHRRRESRDLKIPQSSLPRNGYAFNNKCAVKAPRKPDVNTIRYPREVPLTPVFKELGLTSLLSVERKTEGHEIFGQCPTVKQAHVSRARRKKCKVCLHDFDFWFWFEL